MDAVLVCHSCGTHGNNPAEAGTYNPQDNMWGLICKMTWGAKPRLHAAT